VLILVLILLAISKSKASSVGPGPLLPTDTRPEAFSEVLPRQAGGAPPAAISISLELPAQLGEHRPAARRVELHLLEGMRLVREDGVRRQRELVGQEEQVELRGGRA